MTPHHRIRNLPINPRNLPDIATCTGLGSVDESAPSRYEVTLSQRFELDWTELAYRRVVLPSELYDESVVAACDGCITGTALPWKITATVYLESDFKARVINPIATRWSFFPVLVNMHPRRTVLAHYSHPAQSARKDPLGIVPALPASFKRVTEQGIRSPYALRRLHADTQPGDLVQYVVGWADKPASPEDNRRGRFARRIARVVSRGSDGAYSLQLLKGVSPVEFTPTMTGLVGAVVPLTDVEFNLALLRQALETNFHEDWAMPAPSAA